MVAPTVFYNCGQHTRTFDLYETCPVCEARRASRRGDALERAVAAYQTQIVRLTASACECGIGGAAELLVACLREHGVAWFCGHETRGHEHTHCRNAGCSCSCDACQNQHPEVFP